MMKERLLTNTEPIDVFHYFEDLTFIPRESGNEKEVSDYLVNFAKEHGLEYKQDKWYNVLIRKEATPGYEDHPGVIVQAHMDMVCEKNGDVEHDFAKDPIVFEVEEDRVIAKNTTLGADDGIGVSFGLALLADDSIKHPAIEFVCTSDEERGLQGIENFDFTQLKGDYVINVDSDDEGVVVVGCAGGPVVKVNVPVRKVPADHKKEYYAIKITGLRGGHSGEDIHRGRANANKLLIRVLRALEENVRFDLSDITGGLKYNAIPRNAEAVIGIEKEDKAAVEAVIERFSGIFADEYRVNDPGITLEAVPQETADHILDEASSRRVLDYIDFTETGIIRRDQDYPQFVESSVSLGTISIKNDSAEIWIMTRSSKESQHRAMFQRIISLTKAYDGIYEVMSDCPAWEFDSESQLKKKFEDVFRELYGKDPSFMILHAGLEPCEFAVKVDRKLDMISLGPDIRDLHAPGEYVVISSTQRVWECFKRLIESL